MFGRRRVPTPDRNDGLPIYFHRTLMNTQNIIRFVILGLLWLGLVVYILAFTPRITLLTIFPIAASAIIIFVPMYKKYVKNNRDRH